MSKTIGEMLDEDAIDRGAAALRSHQMSGRFTVEWERLPKAQKRKWIEAAALVINAAKGGDA